MKQSIYTRMYLLVILATLILTSCSQLSAEARVVESDLPRDTSPSVDPADLDELVEGNQAFALDLLQALLEEEDGNLFYSPYSISQALAMTYVGTRNVTEQEMAEVLHFTLAQDRLHPAFNALDLSLSSYGEAVGSEAERGFQLYIANSIWGQKGFEFLPEFLDRLAENYGAGLRLLDFGADPEKARQIINKWVSDQTEEKIKDLLREGILDSGTRLVLANAIYFNADWLYPFEEGNTYEGDFVLLDGSTRPVAMMSQVKGFPYAQGEDYQAIALPYVGGDMEMVIFLPVEGRYDDFESSLDGEKLREILGRFEMEGVSLSLPKFEFESEFSLSEILIKMGMPSAFGAEADFSGINGNKNLAIKDVVHKSFISVDERGTEAAAATAVIMVESAMEPAVTMTVDRPFIFMIREVETGAILFLGRVMDPAE
ncbi:MAG: hypothetical protein A2Z14_18110 [Chloroflexi bacterium RBG_16_48_8]|nr:MAG: hypothetical protein A2Z14_18110 [Chloroflexi bacterium RBG_16_48_8]